MEKVFTAFIFIAVVLHYAEGIRFIVSVPNFFQLDVPETVSVTISEHAVPVEVELYLKDSKQKVINLQRLLVRDGQPQITTVRFAASDIPKLEKNESLIVYFGVKAVKGEFPAKEVKIPVRKYSGYAFVQTDKPLYNPKETVQIRVFHLNEKLLPNEKPFELKIKNPNGQTVFHKEYKAEQKGITETVFRFSSIPLLGNWSVTAAYGYEMSGQSTVHFELKEYVLPTFSVTIQPPKVILNNQHTIQTKVIATYVYGKPVEGLLNIKYAIKSPSDDIVTIGSQQLVKLVKGERYLSLDVQKDIVRKNIPWFPAVSGSHFIIEAEVIETATGNRESSVDESTILSYSPYTVTFPRSMKDFKPGVPYQVQVDVKLTNGQRAPGIPVKVTKAVTKINGANSRVLPVPLPLISDEVGTVMFEFDTVGTDQQLEISVTTDDSELDKANQASGTLLVNNFKSPDGNSYVWIAAPQDVIFKVGKTFQTKVTVFPAVGNIKLHYVVVSRGRILAINETESQQGAVVRTVQFVVTPEMSPSSRLVVYIVRNNHIIADSMRFEVEKKCKYNNGKELKIQTKAAQFKPGSPVDINIHGEPDSYVGLVAVDRAVYLLNKEDLLTRQAMFVELSKRDTGCGPGGGINTEAVFRNAGLLIISNAAINAHDRQGDCNVVNNKRKKRSIAPAPTLLPNVNDYTGLAAKCCKIGLMESPPGLDCKERAAYIFAEIGDAENCSQAFLDCCEKELALTSAHTNMARSLFEKQKEVGDIDDLQLLQDMESDTLKNIRWIFPETWIFNSFKIGSKDCRGQRKEICELNFAVPHSITTWLVQAVGISQTSGICVAESVDLVVFKSIFIQMQLPYSAVRGEQIEVPVTVFNYEAEDIAVTVYMYGMEGVCMGAGPGEKSEPQKIMVKKNSGSTVTFPVMPLEVAAFPLRVIAISSEGSDAVEKTLNVVPEGLPVIKPLSVTLDPRGVMRSRKKRDLQAHGVEERFDIGKNQQSLVIDLTLPKEHVPGTGKCVVSAMGDLLGQAVITSIQGLETRFFRLPSGCGEQTMITLAPLVYTMLYLKRSDKLTAGSEKTGYGLMQQGYAHQLTYRKPNGAFSVFTSYEPSTWLTAFVAKVFCQADLFIDIPANVRCSAVNWLLTRQRVTGAFFEINDALIIHKEMTGGVLGDTTLTAFGLIALLECDKCDSREKSTASARAISYLEQQLDVLNQPYALSIVTYALALAKSAKAAVANEKLKNLAIYDQGSDVRYWNFAAAEFQAGPKPWVFTQRPTALAVETTSYALLAQLLFDDILYSHPIANWLNQQRNAQGAFVSTQDTVMALQALAEYSFHSKIPPLDMHCNLSSQVISRAKRSMSLTNENAYMLHEVEMPVNGKMHVDVVGKGIATMTVSLHYNVESNERVKCKFDLRVKTLESDDVILPVMPRPDFEDFDLLPEKVVRKVTSEEDQRVHFRYDVGDGIQLKDRHRAGAKDDEGQSQHVVKLQICIRHLEDYPAEMSILEVGIFTGYRPVKEDLLRLIDDPDIPISQYEPSERSVVFYLQQVPHDEDLCIQLRTYREITVGKVQATTVKVYDYYEPDHSCTKFYSPDGGSPMLQPICEGHQCRCVEGQCPPCMPFEEVKNIATDSMRRKALLNIACHKHHFVWNGTLEKMYEKDSFMYFDFYVAAVLKEGLQARDSLIDTTVTFTGRSACACPEMQAGKNYIIMGSDGFRYQNELGDYNYKYLFDKKTSVYETHIYLRNIQGKKEQNLQKTFNWLYNRMVEKKLACDT